MGAATATQQPEPRPLLDRERERAVLADALDAARAGHGRTVVLSGDAGIGKTRLTEHAGAAAREAGMRTAWGRCPEVGGAPGFWPWTQVVRSVLADDDAEELLAAIGPAATWLAQIAPDAAGQAPPPAIARDGEHARFALFDAVRALLGAAARRRPLALLLEDLHVADLGTLHLLDTVARGAADMPLLLVATTRQLELRARPDAAAIVSRIGAHGEALTLAGLPAADIARLATARTGVTVEPSAAETLHRFTEGNPLYADELARVLAAEGSIARLHEAEVRLPHDMAAAIRRRLAPLLHAGGSTLEHAAVVGRSFDVRTLERVTGAPREQLHADLAQAAQAGVLVEHHTVIGRHRFAHVLFREALYAEIPRQARAEIHARVAAVLEEHESARPGGRRLAELAHHWLAAAPHAGVDRAVEYATRAGHEALATSAYEQAAEHFARALGALDLAEGDDDRRSGVLLALSHARMRAGDISGAREALFEAAELGRAAGDQETVARAALGLTVWGVGATTDHAELALLEEALAGLGGDNPALRARLLARLSSALVWSPDIARRRAVAEEALALSRDHGGPRTRGFVLVHATSGLTGPDLLERRVTNAAELKALALRHDELEWLASSLLHRIPAGLEVGDGAGVVADVEALADVLARMRQPRLSWLMPTHRALLAAIEGRWDDYEAHAAEFEAITREQPGTVGGITHRGQRLAVRWTQGRIAEMGDDVTEVLTLFPGLGIWRCVQALVHAEAGASARAAAALGMLAADDFAALPHDHTRLACLGLLAETCVALGDARRGSILEGLLAPYAGRHIATAQGTYIGPVDRHLGQLAALRGALDEALPRFATAAQDAARMNAAPFLARIALDEGLALAAAGDHRAAARLAEAARMADELAMPQIATRARVAASTGPAPPSAAPLPAPAPTPAASVLRLEGDVWSIAHDGRVIRVRDGKGLRHLAVLLANPGHEVHALSLGGGAGPGAATPAEAGLGPQLDAQAKREYRARLGELTAELDEAETFHDPERADRIRTELEFVREELSGALGLGGRDRTGPSDAERARVNVTRAIRGALRHITELDPVIGHELAATVRTGTFCAHEPDPRAPVRWRVEA